MTKSLSLIAIVLCLITACTTSEPKAECGFYNILDFGAKGDGITDDTAAIQSAIDYITEHNGGTLFFPIGIYRLATIQIGRDSIQAHLFIRERRKDGDKERNTIMLRIKGESSVSTPCNYANHSGPDKFPTWKNGTILYSDILGEVICNGNAIPTSVLAAEPGFTSYKMNTTSVRLEDIAICVKSEEGGFPRLSGVNLAYAATVYADNILIYSSTVNSKLSSPTDAGHYSAGFIGPRVWCNPEENFQNISVKSAFRYGFIFSEHANGNNLSAWNCDNAYAFAYMDHSAWFGRIHAQNCANILTSLDVRLADHLVGHSFVKVEQVGLETNVGQTPTYCNYKNFVFDPNNNIRGSYEYHIVKSNVGAYYNDYKCIGGDNFQGKPLFKIE
ncbi:MAG: hypothetical protein IKD24_02670 [Alistipes sp.]|nr:hypothetical protein [Alistipes sp.]